MDTSQLTKSLVSWIKERVLTAGCSGVVVGLSGGIDSSVLVVLCQSAFPQNTIGVFMPCYSNQEDGDHALMVAQKFSIPTKTVMLDTIFDSLIGMIANDRTDHTASHVAEANLKARLRMLTLYYLANQLQYMVVGSSNKSELSIGYFTKYGDGGVDILPLGNLVKRQIGELARFLDIPRQIIDKPPSAGLWPGQTDENELGFNYEDLDHYLTTGKVSQELKGKIEPMIKTSNHKRLPPPIANLQT